MIYYKLSPRFYGPFQVTEMINDVTVCLELPPHWEIHKAFHVSLLKKFPGALSFEPIVEDPLEFEGSEQVLVREHILFHNDKTTQRGLAYHLYLVNFKAYPASDGIWIDEEFFHDYPHILDSYVTTLQLRTTEN